MPPKLASAASTCSRSSTTSGASTGCFHEDGWCSRSRVRRAGSHGHIRHSTSGVGDRESEAADPALVSREHPLPGHRADRRLKEQVKERYVGVYRRGVELHPYTAVL